MTFLSNQPLKGMIDEFPEDMALYKWMRGKIDKIARINCYREYDAPVIEPLEVFSAKSSQELIEEQSYHFNDKGERSLILRPEITPSLARMVSKIAREKPRPFRWYALPKCYRYERPQKGRLREFRQLNFDLIGDPSHLADLEIILLIIQLMDEFEVPRSAYTIRFNDRLMLKIWLEAGSFSPQEQKYFFSLVDKHSKLSEETFENDLNRFFSKKSKRERVMTYLKERDPQKLFQGFKGMKDAHRDIIIRIESFLDLLDRMGLRDAVIYDPSTVRGLDYYTGRVFEVHSLRGDLKRALFGGGRYDNLVGQYSGEKVTGVGFGMGIYIFTLFLREQGLLPESLLEKKSCLIVFMEEKFFSFAHRVRLDLQAKSTAVEVMPLGGSVRKALAKAQTRGHTHMIVVGEDEIKNNHYRLKKIGDISDKSLGETVGLDPNDALT